MRLSAIVITYNEESNIEHCLRSISWADEIVMVDAMSQDRTLEIARKFSPRVFEKQWEGYYQAWSYALSVASGEWVLAIAADERVTEDLKSEIQETLKNPLFDGYLIPRKSFFLGKWIKHCGWYPDRTLRLFRREKGYVTNKLVHEGFRVNGKTGLMRAPILHYTCPDLRSYLTKVNHYSSLKALELYQKGRRATAQHLIFPPIARFLKMYFLKLGFLDGIEGFLLSVLSGFSVFIRYTKLLEMQREAKK